LVLIALLLSAYAARAQDWIYTARPGDTLWGLSDEFLQSTDYWRRLQEYNGIADGDHILPGTRIRMPIAWLKRQPQPALLAQLRGTVERLRGDEMSAEILQAGAELVAGDRIRTGEDSSATIRFADGSRVLMQSNTELTLDTMSAFGASGMVDTSMRLHGGRIESDVPHEAGSGSRFRIISPSAVAAVRGTIFRIAFERDLDRALSEVVDGDLGVSASGVSLSLPAGFGNVTRTGEPPGEPVALLPAPDLAALPSRLPAQPIAFDWPDLEGANLYRGQVFEGAGFDRLLLEQVVVESQIEWQALPLGGYVFRARAIDANGLEGANADHSFSIEALLLAPILMGPDNGAATPGQWLSMSWEVPDEAGGFHLQVARDPDFSELVIDETALEDWKFRPHAALEPAVYFWRVATIDRNGTRGPFGESRRFRIQPVPRVPVAERMESDGKRPLLRWTPGDDAVRFRLEVSRDSEFSDLAMITELTKPELVMPDLSPGIYYLRLQSLSDEGVAGGFSDPVRVKVKGWPVWTIVLVLLLAAVVSIAFVLRRP
jgi:hypothetical protein